MNEFLKRIEKFLIKHSMSATAFGIKSMKNPRFVHDLRKGKSCTLATMDKVTEFMSNYDTTNKK